MLKIILAGIGGVVVVVLAIALIRFNRKRLHIIRCAHDASADQLEAIYSQIGQIGNEAPSCAVLARTNRPSANEGDWHLTVPSFVEPWAGRSITVEAGRDVTFRFGQPSSVEPVLRGQIYRVVPVPRRTTKTGKARNQFSPNQYVAGNPELLRALENVCPAYPTDLLSYLLAIGVETFEFDPMFQARLGGSPSWVQDAEFPECDECRKRMNLVLQLPGTLLPGRPLPRGTFYFFSCARHPEKTKTVAQFT